MGKGKIRNNKDQPTDLPKRKFSCMHCGKTGHYLNDCMIRKKAFEKNSLHKYNKGINLNKEKACVQKW